MIDVGSLMPLFYILILFMIVAQAFQMYKKWAEKRRKVRRVEIPRDTGERLRKASIRPAASGIGPSISGRLLFSGDHIVPGHCGGYVAKVDVETGMYIFFIRAKWWAFWQHVLHLLVEPERVSDFNAGDIVVTGRGIQPISEYYYGVTPCDWEPGKELIDAGRLQFLEHRTLRISIYDLYEDLNATSKEALRGLGRGRIELDKIRPALTLTEEELDEMERRERGKMTQPQGAS